MPSYAHTKLLKQLSALDMIPAGESVFATWLLAGSHLAFLHDNAKSAELALSVISQSSFIDTVVVRNTRLFPLDSEDILNWNFGPAPAIASYVTRGTGQRIHLNRTLNRTSTRTLEGAMPLVFRRTFDGAPTNQKSYYEVNQEYTHCADLHWRDEQRGYCRINADGDLEAAISTTVHNEDRTTSSLVSFAWEPLEEYLTVMNASLVRMFDFTLWRPGNFSGWTDAPRETRQASEYVWYRQRIIPGVAGYCRGVQIIRPRRPRRVVLTSMDNRWNGREPREHVDFIARDWRNDRIVRISTDPHATTSYFDAHENSLPFELSPAFFRPEVLMKYKGDRDKYIIADRTISCRGAWYLRGFDINDAGQVHAYICDLRSLPISEQRYWQAFNEAPQDSISERAFVHDFEGRFATFPDPLEELRNQLSIWQNQRVEWWKLRAANLLDRVHVPLAGGRDEWGNAYLELAKLVVEGFETAAIRAKLTAMHITYTQEKSIALVEKVLRVHQGDQSLKLDGLRLVQEIRSKVSGHVGGSDADALEREALRVHGSFANQFRAVCAQVATELAQIEEAFTAPTTPIAS